MSDAPEKPEEIELSVRDPAPIEIPVEKVIGHLEGFAHSQSSTGIALLLAVLLALGLANSDYRDLYLTLNHLPFGISLGEWSLKMSLHHWVNDGLMVLFFFILGLEIKREVLVGELRDPRQSLLVFHMALGGMLIPALVYLLVVLPTGTAGVEGWGIPMATDTAFALGILALLGTRAPATATMLLSALAIVDDIGAILVIGLFYTANLDAAALLGAAVAFGLLVVFNVAGLRHPLFYLAGGILLWWFILQSGIHATTAGILAALTVPARPYASTVLFRKRMSSILRRFEDIDRVDQTILEAEQQHDLAQQARKTVIQTTTPLQRWENFLDRPVSLFVLPVFAFLNAGVVLGGEGTSATAAAPVGWGIGLGLVMGKVVGISGFAWLGLRAGWCSLPQGFRRVHLVALGFLAGIGFTMSLFIASLAFATEPQLLAQAKLGILLGSLVAGLLGAGLFMRGGRE